MIGSGRASFTSFTGVDSACVPINNPQLMLLPETIFKLGRPLKRWERPCGKNKGFSSRRGKMKEDNGGIEINQNSV